MKIFSYLYDKVLSWSGHKYAPWILGCVSFAESSFFPIPPDVMLVTMTLANKERYKRYFLIASIFSVLGGILGYILGMFFINLIYPYITQFGHTNSFVTIQEWFVKWDFWIIFIAGFSPIPYKVFTIGAGVMKMNVPIFIFASLVSRGLRYFIITLGTNRFEKNISNLLRQYVDILGWLLVLSIIVFYFFYHII